MYGTREAEGRGGTYERIEENKFRALNNAYESSAVYFAKNRMAIQTAAETENARKPYLNILYKLYWEAVSNENRSGVWFFLFS